MLKNILRKDGKIVSIYTVDDSPYKFDVGICLSLNDELLLFQSISKYGLDDGLICMHIDDIYRVNYDGQYEKSIEKVKKIKSYENINIIENNLQLSLLKYASQNNYIVEIFLYNGGDDNVIGYIEYIDDYYVKIKTYDEYGNFDGYSVVKLDDIKMILCNSLFGQKVRDLIKK